MIVKSVTMKEFLATRFLLLVVLATIVSAQSDSFDEELMLKPLPSGHVYAYFQFTTLWETENDVESLQHVHLFPRGLAEIIGRHSVDELHITLTQGLWKYKSWGYPFHDAGPGAEITAWFNKKVENVNQEWKGLTNALAGLLCTSLNFMDSTNSLSPEFTFQPTGAVRNSPNASYLRYSSLPRETVCTENLTPFKKLLPCDSKKGLATLLIAASIHNTNYHSLGIHFRTVCRNQECTKVSLELRQTVSLVYDSMLTELRDWSFPKYFGTGLSGACPLATISSVYVDISSNNTVHSYELRPEPTATTMSFRGGQENKIVVYDVRAQLNTTKMFNVACLYKKKTMASVNYPSILYANRFIVGYGQERGSLVTKLQNNHWKPIDIVLLENVPWFLSLYLHTMKITNQGQEIQPIVKRYIPGRDRERPHYLELVLQLPAHSMTKISIEIEYSFLKWQEYPPDANHGFYVGPAVITAFLPIARNYTALPIDGSTITSVFNASREGYLVELRTESLIINLPTPNFSMPYNVLCLTCFAIAILFPKIHSMTTKRFNASREGYLVELRTESLIINLPTPDFSMPYNVLCLTCTGIAIVFAPIHNMTSKRLVIKTESKGLFANIINFLKKKLKLKEKDE